uniref:Coilin n=1 Tax=Rhizophora mucronata TaxID=61149 RepID=A0A2P2KS53_RHIMU
METTVRLRLEFDNILSELQKAEDLKLCWILLKPEHKTISDLASYLLRVFDLQNACPGGLLLSMESFVLPSFESTFIFKDKDIVRVEKRGRTSSEVAPIGDGLNSLDVVEIVDLPQVAMGTQLLANEEFDKESGGYESKLEVSGPGEAEVALQEEEPAESKKRKRKDSKEKQRSKILYYKRKKSKCSGAEKCVAVFENGHGGNNVCREHEKILSTLKADQRSDKSGKATASANGSCHPQENGKEIMDAPIVPIAKKISRSSRRKQVNRQRLRERAKAEKKQQHQRQSLEKSNQQSTEKDNQQVAEQSNDDVGEKISEGPEKSNEKVKVEQEQPDQESDMDDVIPVVIRPGHIRYESRKKVAADQTVQQNQISVETFRWNGVTSKKRGQKWGTEKPVPHKRIDCRNDHMNLNQECSRMLIIEEKPVYEHIDFDKLSPYVGSPKVCFC